MNLKNKNIVITGANGFVGSNAVHHFYKLGASITAITSPQASQIVIDRQLKEIKSKIKIKKLDLLSPKDAIIATKKQDIVLHFAAIDGNAEFKKRNSAEIFSKNIRINLNMLESSVSNSVKVFFLMSSADIYASSPNRLITEKSHIDISLNKNIDGYKLAKWTTELAAEAFNKQYGLRTIIARPSNLYGPRDEFQNLERMRFTPSIIKKIYKTEDPIVLWGDKSQKRSFLYINDFLFICQQLIEKEIFQTPVNIASKQNISLEDLAKKIITISNIKKKIITKKIVGLNSSTKKFDLSLLETILPNFVEVDLSKGLEETIKYYRDFSKKK